MKIYSELQITQALKHYNVLDTEILKIISFLEPIELPSDEDMEQEAYYKVSDHTENPYASFKSGAKWMKEQIIGLETNNIEAV